MFNFGDLYRIFIMILDGIYIDFIGKRVKNIVRKTEYRGWYEVHNNYCRMFGIDHPDNIEITLHTSAKIDIGEIIELEDKTRWRITTILPASETRIVVYAHHGEIEDLRCAKAECVCTDIKGQA